MVGGVSSGTDRDICAMLSAPDGTRAERANVQYRLRLEPDMIMNA